MPKPCVVSVGIGKWYPRGLTRQADSLAGQPVDVVHWSGALPPNSPSHYDNPYAFKLHAISDARRQGYEQVFWLDASIWAIRPLAPLLALLSQRGYLLWNAGWSVGQWCTDAGLERLGIDREAALKIEMAIAGCVAFDFRFPVSCALFDAWMAHARDGVSFVGPWSNDHNSMSSDSRVLGHRHDMPYLGFHSHRLGMERIAGETLLQYWKPQLNDSTILTCQGML